MDILAIAELINEITYDKYTLKQKQYFLNKAVMDKVISQDDAALLLATYGTADNCEDPWDHKFTAVYHGTLFTADIPNDFNEIGFDDPHGEAWDWIHFYGKDMEITVYDNEYGLVYDTITDEWN